MLAAFVSPTQAVDSRHHYSKASTFCTCYNGGGDGGGGKGKMHKKCGPCMQIITTGEDLWIGVKAFGVLTNNNEGNVLPPCFHYKPSRFPFWAPSKVYTSNIAMVTYIAMLLCPHKVFKVPGFDFTPQCRNIQVEYVLQHTITAKQKEQRETKNNTKTPQVVIAHNNIEVKQIRP